MVLQELATSLFAGGGSRREKDAKLTYELRAKQARVADLRFDC